MIDYQHVFPILYHERSYGVYLTIDTNTLEGPYENALSFTIESSERNAEGVPLRMKFHIKRNALKYCGSSEDFRDLLIREARDTYRTFRVLWI